MDHGVYIHIPFCASRCDYCAFATWTDRHHLIADYLEALRVDIARTVQRGMAPATSVFVGGGTPTQVPADDLAGVVRSVPLVEGAEVTVECNPDDITSDVLAALIDGGVTRVSLGVQSMVPAVLSSLGRTHAPANVTQAVDAVRRAGLASFNIDVIYGAAGESVAAWERTLRDVLAFDPPHVSAYGLTVEPGTPLAAEADRHPDDDVQADMYEVADGMLSAAGLSSYEVSNWARPGHESRHNRLYWDQGDYRGFGCAAHSHRTGRRWWNVHTPERYIDLVRRDLPTEAAGETLDPETRRQEGLQLALRTRRGVPVGALDPHDVEGDLAALVRPIGDRLVLTRSGRLLANEVSVRLL